jgi:hypothetical protein
MRRAYGYGARARELSGLYSMQHEGVRLVSD